jgi:hypothetical protein
MSAPYRPCAGRGSDPLEDAIERTVVAMAKRLTRSEGPDPGPPLRATPPPPPVGDNGLHDDGWYATPIDQLVARYGSEPNPDPPWPASVARPDITGERKIRGVTAADPDTQVLAGYLATRNPQTLAEDLADLDKLIETYDDLIYALESPVSFGTRCVAECYRRKHEAPCRVCAALITAKQSRDQFEGVREERTTAAELAARNPDFWYAEHHRKRRALK